MTDRATRFTLEPDAEPSMPNFDQWTTPSLTNTTGGQNEPEVVTDELDIDIVPGDPAVYYGPSRDTDSERYCLLWDGRRSFTVDIGCMRIDESQLIARMSKTNKALQPPPMRTAKTW
jgi:hypothetical protein